MSTLTENHPPTPPGDACDIVPRQAFDARLVLR